MREVDALLERFPNTVTLFVSQGRKLLGLVLSAALAAFCAWMLLSNDPLTREYRAGGYATVMVLLSLATCGGLAVRALILILVPRAASLTLDADSFAIDHVFRRVHVDWRNVSEFRIETTNWRNGSLRQVVYEVQGTGRRGVVPEYYGSPRVHSEELARLMNDWRRRALTLSPRPSVPVISPED